MSIKSKASQRFGILDAKLDTANAGILKLQQRDDAELEALRAKIAALIDELAIDQADKDALNLKIAAALDKSAIVEDRLRNIAAPVDKD